MELRGQLSSCLFCAILLAAIPFSAVASVSIDVLGPQDQEIELACRSTGWFPSPEVHWVTKNGQDLQPVTKTEQDHELLFSVLSHVTILGEETGEISCVIQNSLLKTEQKSVILLSGEKNLDFSTNSKEYSCE
ncbi:butyrophilin subfamily 3 member A2-like isoform X1 [Lepidochelys kempii]|uniref:butyrophilin subfamily 3 member A2-like isoform X1 n=1 Tax=Lepidochelys kempii TaxID=8472 RepID=UPI003C6FE62C